MTTLCQANPTADIAYTLPLNEAGRDRAATLPRCSSASTTW